ncbi:CopD family protein [Paenibacillus sp. GYB004]|uniref:copper resistance D family protein n=1 Tax=Paenibacillus sp. GYB004 TaxID=2994393 RepID=UPI002F965265
MMVIAAWVAEALVYLCFTCLLGGLLVSGISSRRRPDVDVPKWIMIVSVLGIAILSFVPLWRIILFFAEDLGFWLTFKSVVFTFEEGKAYLLTVVLSIMLILMLYWGDFRNDPLVSLLGAAITFAMILALGWASHASSLYGLPGFIAHTIHFVGISVWCGILFCIGWFARNHNHWREFLAWFSPVSIISVSMIGISGLIMMRLIVPEYYNSWILSYGQALLIKHLLIIPVVFFVLFNAYWMKKIVKSKPDYNPLPWFRGESILLALIFITTGFMGQQTPPHDVSATLNETSPSPLFLLFYQNPIQKSFEVNLALNLVTLSLLVVSVFAMAVMIASLMKKKQVWIPVISGLVFVCSAYMALMASIV